MTDNYKLFTWSVSLYSAKARAYLIKPHVPSRSPQAIGVGQKNRTQTGSDPCFSNPQLTMFHEPCDPELGSFLGRPYG